MFDAATLREELTAIEQKLKITPNDNRLLNRWMTYTRKLRDMEYRDNGYVTARSSITGY